MELAPVNLTESAIRDLQGSRSLEQYNTNEGQPARGVRRCLIPTAFDSDPSPSCPAQGTLVAGIHVFAASRHNQDVDGRDKPGHDDLPNSLDVWP